MGPRRWFPRRLFYQPHRDPGWYHDVFGTFFDSNEGVTWLARPNREKKLGEGRWSTNGWRTGKGGEEGKVGGERRRKQRVKRPSRYAGVGEGSRLGACLSFLLTRICSHLPFYLSPILSSSLTTRAIVPGGPVQDRSRTASSALNNLWVALRAVQREVLFRARDELEFSRHQENEIYAHRCRKSRSWRTARKPPQPPSLPRTR